MKPPALRGKDLAEGERAVIVSVSIPHYSSLVGKVVKRIGDGLNWDHDGFRFRSHWKLSGPVEIFVERLQ